MEYRYLEKGEDILWNACCLGQKESSGETAFTQRKDFVPQEYAVIVENSNFLAKARIIIETTQRSILVDPFIPPGERFDEIGKCLLDGYIRDFSGKVKVQQALLQGSVANLEKLKRLLIQSGFREIFTKFLYEIDNPKIKLPPSTSPITYVTTAEMGEETTLGILDEIISDSLEKDLETPADLLENFRSRALENGEQPGENWFIGMVNGEPIGIIFPDYFDKEAGIATNLYIGVRPCARKKGYGKILQAKSISLLIEKGAKKFLDSTEIQNVPMKKIFKSLGYKKIDTQYYFGYSKKER